MPYVPDVEDGSRKGLGLFLLWDGGCPGGTSLGARGNGDGKGGDLGEVGVGREGFEVRNVPRI